jgi:hypothetical protein
LIWLTPEREDRIEREIARLRCEDAAASCGWETPAPLQSLLGA